MFHVEILSVCISAQFWNIPEKFWTVLTFQGVSSTSVSLVLANMPETLMALEVSQTRMSFKDVRPTAPLNMLEKSVTLLTFQLRRNESSVSEEVFQKAPDMSVILVVLSQYSMPESVVSLTSPRKRSLMEYSVSPQASIPATVSSDVQPMNRPSIE